MNRLAMQMLVNAILAEEDMIGERIRHKENIMIVVLEQELLSARLKSYSNTAKILLNIFYLPIKRFPAFANTLGH